MVIWKIQISAVIHQQNDKTKTNETSKKTDRLIGNHMLVISSDNDFNHDGDGKVDVDVELHQLCSLGRFLRPS